MAERPIIFSAESVRAILDGSKTITRRVVKPQPFEGRPELVVGSPYGRPGDTLWVKETWQYANWTEDGYPFVRYRSNGAVLLHENIPEESGDSLTAIWCELSESENYDIDGKAADRKWRSPIFMPRWASRLTLTVTDVRVERLQDITEADAIAEGLTKRGVWWDMGREWEGDGAGEDPIDAFAHIWDAINANRGFSWTSNCWVWRVAFSRTGGANA